ncbi:Formiminotetrahydrofolate cyclodeaminase [Clostridium cavendishii DSM 21758]|uniref:Formiminotetrahydrofolate cyclodeaminase n=1 Tax=Clostridium cavendishii DSM 21758 TaxID=1121302 RepID=A0A1M6KQS7_9CLOT|nr:cyclodeaminase/cyclohydrolase family protein [Clostridium cavendishii]SHJ61261.1 Formiminotetrahydrofolate cyclodeaminase [Clostridium cavendishii DSM 21758]
MLNKLTIEGFLNELASSAPVPGGGGAAALLTSIAAALNAMVYNLTLGKKAYEDLSEENKIKLEENLKKSEDIYKEALKYMDKDKEAFLELIMSYKLSKDSVEKEKIRKEAIQCASKKCLNTPLELAKMSLKFYENIKFAMIYGNKNLISDAGVAAITLHAAIESSLLNVTINLSSIKDIKEKEILKEEIERIRKVSVTNKEEISGYIYNYIN